MDHLRAVKRAWWLLLLLPIVSGGGFFLNSRSQHRVYEARSTVDVTPVSTITDASGFVDVLRALHDGSLLNTLVEMISGPSDPAVANNERRITASIVQQSNLVEVVGTGDDPVKAAALVKTAVVDGTRTFESLHPVYKVHVVAAAAGNPTAISPHPIRDGGVAALGALALAYMIAVAVEAVRRARVPASTDATPGPLRPPG